MMNELKKYKFARLINNPNKKRHGWPYTQINDLYNCLNGEKKDSNFKKLHQAIYESTEKEKAKLFDIYKDRFLKSFKEKFVLSITTQKALQ